MDGDLCHLGRAFTTLVLSTTRVASRSWWTPTGAPVADIVAKGLTALRNLDHRGASGSDPKVGDGAGMLVQIPDAFLREVAPFQLPAAGAYAVGIAFLPRESGERDSCPAADPQDRAPGGARPPRLA